MNFIKNTRFAVLTGAAALMGSSAMAAEINYVMGAVGRGVEVFKESIKPWEEETGHTVNVVTMPASTSDQFGQYRLWLAAQNADIDVYMMDVIWAPQLAQNFIDLTPHVEDLVPLHFESVIQSQTVDGRIVAMPIYTDAPALYSRTDLLEKYGKEIPETWQELTETAQEIMDAERAEGNDGLFGFVFQGNAYEGLTCDALEWVNSHGGGQIVEPDGTISINNPEAAEAINLAASWVGTIAPEGVLAYQEEESRGVFQNGDAVFMRNWPYAYGLGNAEGSPIKGKFEVTPLPSGGAGSAATLGGWNVGVSKFSPNQEAAISMVRYMTSPEYQKTISILNSHLPTVVSLYEDEEVLEANPFIANWKEVFEQSVPRPSAPTKENYNEVSSLFWSAVHDTMSGNGTAEENLEILELDLEDLKGGGW